MQFRVASSVNGKVKTEIDARLTPSRGFHAVYNGELKQKYPASKQVAARDLIGFWYARRSHSALRSASPHQGWDDRRARSRPTFSPLINVT